MEKLNKPRFFSKTGHKRSVSAMLLLSCLLLFCTVHVVAADAQLQEKTISLDLKDVSLLDALREINRLSGNQLLFRNEEVAKETGKVNATLRDASVLDAVAEVLHGASLKHIVRGDVIVISPQENTATGVVVDERGQPLSGVTISVIGTAVGVATNPDGTFSVKLPEGRTRLRISYVSYVTQEVTAAVNMRIILKQEIYTMSDVVVTGMTSIDRRMFTGATDKLGADDVKLDGIPDVSRALEGRSAGVTLQNVSSTFGTAPKIRVRGSTSILGSSKPLWVVDGVIIEDVGDISVDDLSTGDAVTLLGSAVAGLSADDIEDFQILKDGSATSIYGARAMSGVIVITTKKGKAGEARISYTGEYTIRRKPSYREYDIMNSQDQMSVYQELGDKGWLELERLLRYRNSGVYGQMYKLINTYNDPSTGQFGWAYDDDAMNQYLRAAEMRNTDWFDELFSNSLMQQHSVSVSTGTHKATNYISLSVLDDPGWYKRSEMQRYTARANSNIYIFDNLQLSLNTSASYRNQEAPGTMAQTTSSIYGEISRNFDINPFSYAMNTSRTIAADEYHTRNFTTFNIHEELEHNYMELNVLNAAFQGQLIYNVTTDLTLKALGAVNYSSNSMQWFIKDQSNAARAYREMTDAVVARNNDFLYTNPDNPYGVPETILAEGGILEKTELRMLSYDFRVDATFNKRFNSNNTVHVFAGMEINNTERTRDVFQGWGLLYDYGELANLNYLAFKKLDEDSRSYFSLRNTNKRNVAFFTTATYSFRDKYVLNGTFRYEGTNRMGRVGNARWLPTWNVSGNWNISQESFFDKIGHIFSDMKLRASYSLTADTGPSWVTNSTDLIYSTVRWRHDSKGQETGLYISESGNADLTYEKKHELNIGFDFAVLKNRLSFQTDIYWRNNFDLIGLLGTQGLSGEIRRYANVADMKTRGLEVTVSSRNIVMPKFKWNSHLTFSTQKGEITSLLSNANLFQLVRGTTLYSLQGYPTNSLFSIPFRGLDSDGLPTYADPYDKTKTINQSDFYNILQITDEDILKDYLKYEGPSEPTITGGLQNTFTYKNLSLNVFMTYGFGNFIRLRPVFSSRYSDITASSEVFKNRWAVPGDELTTNVPAIINAREEHDITMLRRGYSYYNYSDVRVAKGDFVRMKEISLIYTFPTEMLKKIKTQRLSLKIAAVNPFLIYADKALNGQDPEFVESGGVSSPIAKQFTFTVRLGF